MFKETARSWRSVPIMAVLNSKGNWKGVLRDWGYKKKCLALANDSTRRSRFYPDLPGVWRTLSCSNGERRAWRRVVVDGAGSGSSIAATRSPGARRRYDDRATAATAASITNAERKSAITGGEKLSRRKPRAKF